MSDQNDTTDAFRGGEEPSGFPGVFSYVREE